MTASSATDKTPNKIQTINIAVSMKTWNALIKIGNKGQTFNDIVEQLIKRHYILEEILKEKEDGITDDD